MVKLDDEVKGIEPIYDSSEVMNEFIKITLNKLAFPAPNPYKEDLKTIEDKKPKEATKSIIEVAHPASVYIAESQGDGALVENQLEQQKKMLEVINKMPTGNLTGRYAAITTALLKTAETCDWVGETETADLLTKAAKTLLTKARSGPLT